MHNSMDPSSPTTAEQGLAGQANVPVPPSTTSSHSGRQGDSAQLPFGNGLAGFPGMTSGFTLGQNNPVWARQNFQQGGQSVEQGCVGNQQGLNFQQGFQNVGSSSCGNPCYVTPGPYGCGQGPSWNNAGVSLELTVLALVCLRPELMVVTLIVDLSEPPKICLVVLHHKLPMSDK